MGRHSTTPQTLLAVVRRYFGVSQQELAPYLDVTREVLAKIEIRHRPMSPAVARRLEPLAAQVPVPPPPSPPAATVAPAELVAAAPAPDPGPLDARRDYCRHHAAQLRRALRALDARATYAHRWQLTQPTLLAALPAPDPARPTALPADADAATRAAWVATVYARQWLRARPTALSAADITRWHLLRRRAEALEAEAAALTGLLAGPT